MKIKRLKYIHKNKEVFQVCTVVYYDGFRFWILEDSSKIENCYNLSEMKRYYDNETLSVLILMGKYENPDFEDRHRIRKILR